MVQDNQKTTIRCIVTRGKNSCARWWIMETTIFLDRKKVCKKRLEVKQIMEHPTHFLQVFQVKNSLIFLTCFIWRIRHVQNTMLMNVLYLFLINEKIHECSKKIDNYFKVLTCDLIFKSSALQSWSSRRNILIHWSNSWPSLTWNHGLCGTLKNGAHVVTTTTHDLWSYALA